MSTKLDTSFVRRIQRNPPRALSKKNPPDFLHQAGKGGAFLTTTERFRLLTNLQSIQM